MSSRNDARAAKGSPTVNQHVVTIGDWAAFAATRKAEGAKKTSVIKANPSTSSEMNKKAEKVGDLEKATAATQATSTPQATATTHTATLLSSEADSINDYEEGSNEQPDKSSVKLSSDGIVVRGRGRLGYWA